MCGLISNLIIIWKKKRIFLTIQFSKQPGKKYWNVLCFTISTYNCMFVKYYLMLDFLKYIYFYWKKIVLICESANWICANQDYEDQNWNLLEDPIRNDSGQIRKLVLISFYPKVVQCFIGRKWIMSYETLHHFHRGLVEDERKNCRMI